MRPKLSKQDRLFYWRLSKCPDDRPLNENAVVEAAEHCRVSPQRAVELVTKYPQEWAKVEAKRAAKLSGERVPAATLERVASARMVNLKVRHPRMAKKLKQAGLLP
jgi:hypothetical protein